MDCGEVRVGMKVRTVDKLGPTTGFYAAGIERRAPNVVGVVTGKVGGHGGVWWVERDGARAPYCYTEIESAALDSDYAYLFTLLGALIVESQNECDSFDGGRVRETRLRIKAVMTELGMPTASTGERISCLAHRIREHRISQGI